MRTLHLNPHSMFESWALFRQLPFYSFGDMLRRSTIRFEADNILNVERLKGGKIAIEYLRLGFEGRMVLDSDFPSNLDDLDVKNGETGSLARVLPDALHYLKNIWRYSPLNMYLLAIIIDMELFEKGKPSFFSQYLRKISPKCDYRCAHQLASIHFVVLFLVSVFILGWSIAIFYFRSARKIRKSAFYISTRFESSLLMALMLVGTVAAVAALIRPPWSTVMM